MLLRFTGAPLVLACALLTGACAMQRIHGTGPTESPPPSATFELGDRRILAGDWEYVDGAAVLLTLDEQGNGRYAWKDGRFETQALNDHTWQGMWFQKENDRDGGFTVEFSPDFSEGDGRWWYSRIGTDHAPTEKGGTFHLSRKTHVTNQSETPPPP